MRSVVLIDNGTLGSAKTFFNGGIDALTSEKLQWINTRDASDIKKGELVVFTESAIPLADICPSERKILILSEPTEINTNLEDKKYRRKILKRFQHIFTHHKPLLKLSEKFIYYPHGGTWIAEKPTNEKTKLCSLISSEKRQTKGHKLRHRAHKKFPEFFDTFGKINDNPIACKSDGLSDYMFSIVIENTRSPGYFTEKIVDCFRSRTIPIYWGDPEIGSHFQTKGVLSFKSLRGLKSILKKLNPEEYHKRYHAVIENEKRSQDYLYFEDFFDNWLETNQVMDQMPEFDRFFADEAENRRYDYASLNKDSVVVDVGGYEGNFAKQIIDHFGSFVHIYEPVHLFHDDIESNLQVQLSEGKCALHEYGLSDRDESKMISLLDDGTSTNREGESAVECKFRNVMTELEKITKERPIELLKLNIEGDEFPLLEHMLKAENAHILHLINNLQIQFHNFIDDCEKRRERILKELSKTHQQDWCYHFVWENWSLKAETRGQTD